MRIFVVDNYDSFTYNLVQYLGDIQGGLDQIVVKRNDAFDLGEVKEYDAMIISPGPGLPEDSGLTKRVIMEYSGKMPILGVCLGLQSIVEVFGGRLLNLSSVFHGLATPIQILCDDVLFEGLNKAIEVGRYHSWVADPGLIPKDLRVLAEDAEGQVMALRHRYHPTVGVQFHPESILTPDGKRILKNFLKEAEEFVTTDKHGQMQRNI